MSSLVHSGEDASVPVAAEGQVASSWEAVASEVLEELQPVVEGLARKAADQFYDETLYRIQDYLADNVTFNLASRLQAADRQASHDRHRAHVAEEQNKDLLRALKRLTFSARTTGGVAGPDPALMEACDRAEAAIAKASPTSGER